MEAVPRLLPLFTHRLGRAAAGAEFGDAVTQFFSKAGIDLAVEGDLSSADGSGLIIASDHRHRIEPLLVQGVMHKTGRAASNVITMPTSFGARAMQASGERGRSLVLPVVASSASKENRASWRHPRAALQHRVYPNVFGRTKEELRTHNSEIITMAAQRVGEGGTVTIWPTGTFDEAGTRQWRGGLGKIVESLPAEAAGDTHVALLRPESFSVRKVCAALALSAVGIKSRPQTINMRVEPLGTVNELFGPLASSGEPGAAQEMSDIVRAQYLQRFGADYDQNPQV